MPSERTRAQCLEESLERSAAQLERSYEAVERASIQVAKADGRIEFTEAFLVTARAQVERARQKGFV